MKNKITFGSWEAITVLINLIFVQILLSYPKDMANYGGSAGWMIPVISTIVILVYFSIMAALYKDIGSMDLLDISEKTGG
ncbi:MAG: Spore germination protein, partial [Eubacterium sp.]|nr:Spore germination protein [Eubacterium sp.]